MRHETALMLSQTAELSLLSWRSMNVAFDFC